MVISVVVIFLLFTMENDVTWKHWFIFCWARDSIYYTALSP